MRNWLNSRWSNNIAGFLAVAFMVLFAVVANAQLAGKGQITGTVTDKTGAVIPGAEVTALNTSTLIKTVAKTSAAGDYHFSALEPGIYTVTTVAQGFQTLKQENIHVNAMESQVYNPALTVAGAAPVEITVTAEPPQLETSNATLGSTMEQETYSELPVEMGAYGQADQRRATDFAFLMPGVQGNNTSGNATTNVGIVNGSGSKGAAAAVYVDGIPFVRAGGNGDPRYVWTAISVDAIDQFQVQTVGYSAIYEGQGVMNYSVKSGGAQYHASVYEFIRNTAFDSWGFWGKAVNPAIGRAVKPVEHNNEYGINIGGPLVPFGSLKNKLFFFTNYNGYRYSSATPTLMTFPTAAMQQGDFTGTGLNIFDPASVYTTQVVVSGKTNTVNCRGQFGATGCTTAANVNNAANVIPANRISNVAKLMQQFLPKTGIGTGVSNNYVAQNPTALNNWSTTSRIDYMINSKDTLSVIGAVGRQASSVPVGQNTTGRNVGPVPYNYGQAYAPKTAVWSIEETHTFNSNVLNQLKWGYARYNGPTFTPNMASKYWPSVFGINGGPAGQVQTAFPIVTFAGTNTPTNWGGTTANSTIAENYTALDNLQWNFGKHSITFGGQIAWMLYNTASATGGSTPMTLANTYTESGQFSTSANKDTSGYTVDTTTGSAYASFLLGQFDSVKFTDYNYHPEYGARFRAISPYVQDDWKVNSKLTLNLGLRYDFFPTVREVNNMASFFNPNLANSITGMNGALQYTGYGANTCNCTSPVNNYFKNFGPRVGLAYQIDAKTVVRASYGLMFTHGDAVGGNASSMGTLGFSAAPSWTSSKAVTSSSLNFIVNPTTLAQGSGALPTYTAAAGSASGATYGTGYTTNASFAGTPSSMNYLDPYLGSRAPEYINWSLGVQRQLTNTVALNVTYVGSEGHFLQMDGSNARGYWSNQLDPQYLSLGASLGTQASATNSWSAICAANNVSCPGAGSFILSKTLADLLKPFPFQGVADAFNYVGNSNYHSLQTVLSARNWHGLTSTVSYTWSRSIDNGGQFRAGYAIPTNYINNWGGQSGQLLNNQKFERTVSTSNQPQHLTVTAVYKMPFGKTVFATNRMERMLLGGYTLSGVFQAYSGSPLAVNMSTCNTNPAQSGNLCTPSYNTNFAGPARINGKWGKGVTTGTATSIRYIDANAFVATPNYKFGNLPRTAPYNLYGPGNYQLDFSLSRSFPLHVIQGSKLDFKAQWYNVTNHTQFAVASTSWLDPTSSSFANSSFGQITTNGSANRKAAQFTARISF